MCTINDKYMMYGFWNNEHDRQYFDKMKKNPGDIIILDKCTINDNHMMYGSWDM